MIDPIHSLAFSIQANRGVYAVLLGSGVSRSAKIPTGWEITLDLVRKLAAVYAEPCEPTPDQWYRDRFGHDPDYSELLDALAKTPAERQQLLRGYWEATEAERDDGVKQPTPAHRSIADLVVKRFIKVIITTNFDRLMETALVDVGITPVVLSTPDQVHGALPLIHMPCCIFKIHGDYLDTRIRNTPTELAAYPAEFDGLLDRIFDEFGLIVCGWSADWDPALRSALIRAPSRRFSTYWALRGDPSDAAKKLIDQRGAQVLSITDADTFFQTVQQQVQSLEEFSRPHPLSTEAAVASLKRYLSEPKFRIQLDDLVNNEVERVMEATSGPKFALTGGPAPDTSTMTDRVRAYEAACTTLLAMACVGGYWAEESHYSVWQQALAQLATRRSDSGLVLWVELQRYPATLLLYVLGIGAIEKNRLSFLNALFSTVTHRENCKDLPAVQVLPPSCLFDLPEKAKLLEGMDNRYVPMNDWLYNTLRDYFKRMIPNESQYTTKFDRLEMLMALSYAHHAQMNKERYWTIHGAYGYRHENRQQIISEIVESISSEGEKSRYVKSGIFGNNVQTCNEAIQNFIEFAQNYKNWW